MENISIRGSKDKQERSSGWDSERGGRYYSTMLGSFGLFQILHFHKESIVFWDGQIRRRRQKTLNRPALGHPETAHEDQKKGYIQVLDKSHESPEFVYELVLNCLNDDPDEIIRRELKQQYKDPVTDNTLKVKHTYEGAAKHFPDFDRIWKRSLVNPLPR